MPKIEQHTKLNDLDAMIIRTCEYRELYEIDQSKAAAYWDFVVRGYRNNGFTPAEIDELGFEAEAYLDRDLDEEVKTHDR